jgi:hypothetical protein
VVAKDAQTVWDLSNQFKARTVSGKNGASAMPFHARLTGMSM